MMKRMSSVLALMALCVATPATPREPVDPTIQEGLQVGVGACLFARPRDGAGRDRILNALAAAAITKGVNLLGTAITRLGAAKTWKEQQSRNFQASSSAFPDCIQIVRGRFYRGRAQVAGLRGSLSEKARALYENGLFLSDDPDFLLELRFVAATGGEALALRPIKAIFNHPMGTRALRGGDRSVAAFLAITTPGQSPNLETTPAATIVLGRLGAGSDIDFVDPADLSSPYESSWFTFAPSDTRKPLTITALVTETQDADKFLTFVGGLLGGDDVQRDISHSLQALVIPQVREADAYARETSERSAESVADEKFGTALSKLLVCSSADASTASDAAVAARRALLDFLTADRDPKLRTPRNTIVQADIDSINPARLAEAPQRCGTVYGKMTK